MISSYYERLKQQDYSSVSAAIKKALSKSVWEKSNSCDVISCAYMMLKSKEKPEIDNLDELILSCESINNIINEFGFRPYYGWALIHDEIENEDGKKEPLWNLLMDIRDDFTEDEIKACILFEKVEGLGDFSRSSQSVVDLALKILNIATEEFVADFDAGEGGFFREAAGRYPNNKYFIYEENEDLADIDFMRADVLEMKFNNGVYKNLFDKETENLIFDKIYLEINMNSTRRKFVNKDYLYGFNDTEYFNDTTTLEWAYVLKVVNSLELNGKAVAIIPNVATSTEKDKNIRTMFVEMGFIESVISLPVKLYDDTKTSVTMLVLSHNNKSVTFVDAQDKYIVERRGNKKVHVLNEKIIEEIHNACINNTEISISVPVEEIINNGAIIAPSAYLNVTSFKVETIEFGDVIKKILRGTQLSASEIDEMKQEKNSEYTYITPANIKDGIIVSSEYITSPDNKYNKFVAKKGDLVISKIASPLKIAIVEQDNVLIGGNLYLVELDTEKINPYYLKCFMESSTGLSEISRISNNGALSMLSVKDIKNIRIPKLSCDEQEVIANKYKKINDDILIKLNEISSLLKERNAIME